MAMRLPNGIHFLMEYTNTELRILLQTLTQSSTLIHSMSTVDQSTIRSIAAAKWKFNFDLNLETKFLG